MPFAFVRSPAHIASRSELSYLGVLGADKIEMYAVDDGKAVLATYSASLGSLLDLERLCPGGESRSGGWDDLFLEPPSLIFSAPGEGLFGVPCTSLDMVPSGDHVVFRVQVAFSNLDNGGARRFLHGEMPLVALNFAPAIASQRVREEMTSAMLRSSISRNHPTNEEPEA
jgi:hypothetical protein